MKLRFTLLIFIAIVYVSGNFVLDRWPNNFFWGDTNGYYLHVVSTFIYQDIGDYDETIDAMLETKPEVSDPRKDPFLIRETEVGRKYIKYTVGVPILEAPFFLIGHAYASLSTKYPANGWSTPYLLAVSLAITTYLLIGFYLLIGVLQKYFSNLIVVLTVLAIAFGTNLFFHATYVTMAHGFLFFNYCVLIYLSDRFYTKPNSATGFFIGLMVGLITLLRVPEIVSGFIPVLWGVTGWKSFVNRLTFFGKHYLKLVSALVGFLAIFSIQIWYWRYTSGHFIFNPYEGEGFDFTNPQIFNAWFNYANGWLVYTPIMVFSLIGLFFIRRYAPGVLLPLLFSVGFHVYIHYCYYVWTYFPGLGNRPMVETYAIFSFSMASCFAFFLTRKWLAWIPYVAIILFTTLNFFQTWQMNKGIIWSERHNKAFYWATFGKTTSTLEALQAYDSRERQPDTLRLTRIKRIYFNDFEQANPAIVDSTIVRSGKFAMLPDKQDVTMVEEKLPLLGVQSSDWFKLGMQVYTPMENPIHQRDLTSNYVLEFFDETGKRKKSRTFKPSTLVGNPTNSIWTAGGLNQWGEAYLFIKVPHGWNDSWTIKTFVLNGNKHKVFIDDLYIDLYRKSR